MSQFNGSIKGVPDCNWFLKFIYFKEKGVGFMKMEFVFI